MHVDLIESLRCPHLHADGWLVASADVVMDRRIVQGTVGCPHCGAEWAITDGALHLTAGGPAAPPPLVGRTATARTATARTEAECAAEALRTAALLDLRDARGAVLLTGDAAHAADALAALTGVLVLVINPPDGVAMAHSRLYVTGALPLGVGTLRGARIDGSPAHAALLAGAERAVERSGRIIAPVSCEVPVALRELARDEREWVAEVQVAASGLVPLRRG